MSENVQPFIFGEGATDKVVFENILKHVFPATNLIFTQVKGKGMFWEKIKADVEIEFSTPILRTIPLLVFRDVDEGESHDSIKQSFMDLAEQLTNGSANWQNVQNLPNVYLWDLPPENKKTGLRFVLHLADPIIPATADYFRRLKNKTTDGYVLQLGLRTEIIQQFAEDIGHEPALLFQKITQEIPNLFNQNGIALDTDKDFLAAYLLTTRFWKVKRTEEKERLATIILDRAYKYAGETYRGVFASWIAAIETIEEALE